MFHKQFRELLLSLIGDFWASSNKAGRVSTNDDIFYTLILRGNTKIAWCAQKVQFLIEERKPDIFV